MADGLLESPKRVTVFRRAVLAWYACHKRDLPWRDAGDPYHVWLSEIMLQQTRVDQVQPYFERFVAAFPTVEVLARASEEEVLKAWEGLGYYARARNLRRAAQHVVDELGGCIPAEYDDLLALPGVGPYSAAAISSIAFDRDHPVLDGNVTRILCRLLLVEGNPRRAAVRVELTAAGERLLASGRAGEFNQAMMELGATVCTPRRPQCGRCPVEEFCRARRELDDPCRLPRKPTRKPRPHYEVTAGLIWKGDRLLLAQRPDGGMLGGLWEFPGGKQEAGETLEQCLAREIREELDFEIDVGQLLASVDHAYSHFTITLHAFEARYRSGCPQARGCAAWQWIDPETLDEFPMPRADRLVLEQLGARESQLGLFGDRRERE